MKRIEIIVSPAGETTLQTHGFDGPSCREASQFLESALGRHASERLTGEFFQPVSEAHRLQERG